MEWLAVITILLSFLHSFVYLNEIGIILFFNNFFANKLIFNINKRVGGIEYEFLSFNKMKIKIVQVLF